jgi:hypothetical protein
MPDELKDLVKKCLSPLEFLDIIGMEMDDLVEYLEPHIEEEIYNELYKAVE